MNGTMEVMPRRSLNVSIASRRRPLPPRCGTRSKTGLPLRVTTMVSPLSTWRASSVRRFFASRMDTVSLGICGYKWLLCQHPSRPYRRPVRIAGISVSRRETGQAISLPAKSTALWALRIESPPFTPGYFVTSAKSAPVSRTRSAGVSANTAFGDPAAAQISGYPCKSRSSKVIGTVACPTGGTPPTANPV
jgi:hypothetical protein